MIEKILIGIFIMLSYAVPLTAQEEKPFLTETKFPADSINKLTNELMTELSLIHPGFYRYTPKEEFDHIIETTVNSITDSLTTLEIYRKLKPLFAQIGCLHTSIHLSRQYENFINKEPTLIPIEVFIDEKKRVFITKNHSENKNIRIKSELLSINKKPIEEILNVLIQSIPSDGYNLTVKTLLLNHRFAHWYRSIVELNQNFTIETTYNNDIKSFVLSGVKSDKFETIETLQSINSKQLNFEIADDMAVLTIKSFAKTDIKNNGQHFKRFIKKTFKTLKNNGIENLIVDLRYNSGGTDGNAVFFTSHFFDGSFRYWDRIEVTKSVAEQIKGIHRVFYPKPEKVDSMYLWKGAFLTKEFDYFKTQKPSKNNFSGNVYIITNGLCMSSCSDVVAILSHNQKALVVGQESGGGFQGNTSGMMPTTEINEHMAVTIPLQKYTSAVDLDKNFGRGTIPDFIVNPDLDDWIHKEDVEMSFVKKLIKK